MRVKVKAILVRGRETYRILREGTKDAFRVIRWASRVDSAYAPKNLWSIGTQMTKDYHRVEKGLALSDPKRPFGKDVHSRLTSGLSSLSPDSKLFQHVLSAKDALEVWNSEGVRSEDVAPYLDNVFDVVDAPVSAWFRSRHSVRDFDPNRRVDRELIEEVVECASATTPSVCNRQAWRAYASFDSSTIQRVLALQNGNLGFRESVPCILVVTASRQWFSGAGERNQHLVDGSLFAMSLAWMLHAQGLSSCMLNWSMTNSRSAELRAEIGAGNAEEIIMLLAVGYAANGARVARSPRRELGDVFRVIEG